MKDVLFICTGNVCRSPMAEGLFRHMAEKAGMEAVSGSAGIGAMDGYRPSEFSVEVMAEEGVDISDQRSRMLTKAMVDEASHIFGMTRDHSEAVRAYFPEASEKIFVLREFITEDDFDLDVPDPIGLPLEDYIRTRNLIMEAMPSVMNFVHSGDPENFDKAGGEG